MDVGIDCGGDVKMAKIVQGLFWRDSGRCGIALARHDGRELVSTRENMRCMFLKVGWGREKTER